MTTENDNLIADLAHRLRSSMQCLMCEVTALVPRIEGLREHFETDSTIMESCKNIENIVHFLNNQVESLFDWNSMDVAFSSLLDNAIKYSHSGQIVNIHGSVDTAKNTCQVLFDDFGLRIADEEVGLIFEKFRRGSNMEDPRRFIPGIGIGLTVARRIALDHGGDVYLEECKCGPNHKADKPDEKGWKVVFALEIPIRKVKI